MTDLIEPIRDRSREDEDRAGPRPIVAVAGLLGGILVVSAAVSALSGSGPIADPTPTPTAAAFSSDTEPRPVCGLSDVEILHFFDGDGGVMGTVYAELAFAVIADDPCWPTAVEAAELVTADGPLSDPAVHVGDRAFQHVEVVRPLQPGEQFRIGVQRAVGCALGASERELQQLTALRVHLHDESADWPIEMGGCGEAWVSRPSLGSRAEVPAYVRSGALAVIDSLEIPVWMPAIAPPIPERNDQSFFPIGPRGWVLAWGPPGEKPSEWSLRIEGYHPDECPLPDMPSVRDTTTGATYVAAPDQQCGAGAEPRAPAELSWYWQDPDRSVTLRVSMDPPPHVEGAPLTHDDLFWVLSSMTEIIDPRDPIPNQD